MLWSKPAFIVSLEFQFSGARVESKVRSFRLSGVGTKGRAVPDWWCAGRTLWTPTRLDRGVDPSDAGNGLYNSCWVETTEPRRWLRSHWLDSAERGRTGDMSWWFELLGYHISTLFSYADVRIWGISRLFYAKDCKPRWIRYLLDIRFSPMHLYMTLMWISKSNKHLFVK